MLASLTGVLLLFMLLLFVAALLLATLHGDLPLAVTLYYGAASVVTAILFILDKRAARHGAWRIPESTLHVFALIGGWPGAYLAQRSVHHKTGKPAFQLVLCICVLLNIFCLLICVSPLARSAIRGMLAVL